MYTTVFPYHEIARTTWPSIDQAKEFIKNNNVPAAIKNDSTDKFFLYYLNGKWLSVN